MQQSHEKIPRPKTVFIVDACPRVKKEKKFD